jgi:hypothetical protein
MRKGFYAGTAFRCSIREWRERKRDKEIHATFHRYSFLLNSLHSLHS